MSGVALAPQGMTPQYLWGCAVVPGKRTLKADPLSAMCWL